MDAILLLVINTIMLTTITNVIVATTLTNDTDIELSGHGASIPTNKSSNSSGDGGVDPGSGLGTNPGIGPGTDPQFNEEGGEGGGDIDIGDMSLLEICEIFGVPMNKCNCSNNITFICEMIKERDRLRKDPPTESKCFADLDRIRGRLIIVASVLGLIGNSLVVMVTALNWKKSTICHKLIGGLSLSDNIFSIFQLIDAIPLLSTCLWEYGERMCKFIPTVYNLSNWISLGFILIIAIERFLGIVYPFSRGLKKRSICLMLAVNVIFGFLIIIPMIYHLQLNADKCVEVWEPDNNNPSHASVASQAYSTCLLFIAFIFPLVAIIFMYGKIIMTLFANSSSKAIDAKQKLQRYKDNKRVMKILVSILVSFAVLVFPIRIIWMLSDFGALKNVTPKTFEWMKIIGLVPYAYHVAINPIIYSLIDEKFRNTLKSIFIQRLKNVRTSHSSSNSEITVSRVTVKTVSSSEDTHL